VESEYNYLRRTRVREQFLKFSELFPITGEATRVANTLWRAGYRDISKVKETPSKELLKLRNFGPKALKIISEISLPEPYFY